jgi:hypothetical protein
MPIMEQTHDIAVVSASVPFANVPTTAEMLAALREPTNHPLLTPHLERLLLELPPEMVLDFAHRHGLSVGVIRLSYLYISRAAGLRNPGLEVALDGLA